MNLEQEIKLLKEKVELLEKVKELQDIMDKYEKQPTYIPIPYPAWYPWYPNTISPYPYTTWITTC